MSSAHKREIRRRPERAGMPPRIFDGNEQIGGTSYKPRRRASIEERMRKNAYHSILESGQLPSDLEAIDGVDTDMQGPVQSEPLKEDSLNIQKLQPALPLPNALAETPRPSKVSVLCGRQDPKSWYLTRRLVRMPDNHDDHLVSLVKHRNIDPDAAELHRIWQHTGVVPTRYRDINFDPDGIDPQHTWIACWPLMNAVIHGFMLEDDKFVYRMMYLLDEKIVSGVRPDVDTISHVFGEKRQHTPMMLQHFLVDRWINNSTQGFGDVDPHSLPEFFVCAALDTAMRRLSQDTRSSLPSGCRYHTHSRPDGCYKNRTLPIEAGRQERYKYRREKASREAAQVATDMIEYGIRTVDWEERRAEAHRALHDQVDDYSPTSSSRLEASEQSLEADNPKRLELLDHDHVSETENDLDYHLEVRYSPSPMFGTAQAGGAVDEVKFAPPAREPPPPPPPSSDSARHDDSSVENEPSLEKLSSDHDVAMSLNGDATPLMESEESFESNLLDAPAIPPEHETDARTASRESSREKERVTCPGSFPESWSGTLKSIAPA
ncbi:uncharacterized protein ALTATR162_LOCUS2877 [Alternaria atra]|uniref:Uncharacterized protein n=1 Tax=Alternaria atra TaxID=119953 RepID=A0A8J2HZG8_9PLEO|nr:uncharacterized protein ALTATR162_LOCUS2877 [Alternaria atra]CAG5152704.1 unnamed protein product [Alternaria atra]